MRRDALVGVIVWAAITLLLATYLWLALDRRHELGVVAAWVMAHTTPWLLIAFGVYEIARSRAVLHVGGALVAVMAAPALQWIGMFMLEILRVPVVFGTRPRVDAMILGKLPASLLTYAVLAAIAHVVMQTRRARALETAARTAELLALQARLQPHFLFNALHSVVALIEVDPQAAKAMLVRLSDLLRSALQNNGEQQVPLSAELRWAETYLGIEQVRFRDRLRLQVDVVADAATAQVPALILQPLLENAIKHGIASSEEGGTLSIQATVSEGRLRVDVVTSLESPPIDGNSETHGIGLAATRSRLQLLYGGEARLEHAFDEHGSHVTISLPRGDAA